MKNISLKSGLYRILNRSDLVPQMKSFSAAQYRSRLSLIFSGHENIEKVRLEKLKKILQYAISNIPYYSDITLDFDNFTLKELQKFPVVTKQDIQRNIKLFQPSGILSARTFIASSTSGSTGDPFHFFLPRKSYQEENLAVARSWGVTGCYKLFDPIVNIRSYSPSPEEDLWRYDIEDNFWYLSPFHINQENINKYVEIINNSGARLLRGYPSSIYLFALELQKAGLKIPGIEAVVTSSETLTQEYEKVISSILGVKIFDWYGLNERVVTVQQCAYGNYHNNDDYGILELSEKNEIIGTSLNNNLMPFIRYATGDIAIPQKEIISNCKCGSKFSIPFQRVLGRSDDVLYKLDGTAVPTVNLYTGMYEVAGIKQFKVTQSQDKSLTVQVSMTNENIPVPWDKIASVLRSRLGNLNIDVDVVKEISRDSLTGKFRIFESHVDNRSAFANENVKSLVPYKLSAHKAWENSGDKKILKLDWNESVIPPCPGVSIALNNLTNNFNYNWYPDTYNSHLYSLIADYVGLDPSFIQYFAGSDSSHEYIARSFINQGDRVLILTPTYDNFRVNVVAQGGKIIQLVTPLTSKSNFNAIDNSILANNPKIVYIVNPNNPTGHLMPSDEISELAKKYPNTLFIIDEAYFEFEGVSCAKLVETLRNIIVTRTFSKAFGLAAFRIGYIVGSPFILDVINRIRNAKLISLPAQVAAAAALEDLDYMYDYCRQVKKAKNEFLLTLSMRGFNFISGGGNFVLVDLESLSKKDALLNKLQEQGIYIRNMAHINGLETWVRVTVGTPDIMNSLYPSFTRVD